MFYGTYEHTNRPPIIFIDSGIYANCHESRPRNRSTFTSMELMIGKKANIEPLWSRF